jgi:hypothetical protein
MRSFSGDSAHSLQKAKNSPALRHFANEVCATVACSLAYMGVLALFGILAIHGWNELWADESAAKPPWSLAERFDSATVASDVDSHEKTAAYTILRDRQGGRTADWTSSTEGPQLRGAL